MSTEIIHLTTCEVFRNKFEIDQSQKIVGGLVQSCLELNASIFETFIDEDQIFDGANKFMFLAAMRNTFDFYKENKNLEIKNVRVKDDICNGCSIGKHIKVFTVEYNRVVEFNYPFAFVVDMEDGVLKDIYRCKWGFMEFAKSRHKINQ